jgi:hypothetical protein
VVFAGVDAAGLGPVPVLHDDRRGTAPRLQARLQIHRPAAVEMVGLEQARKTGRIAGGEQVQRLLVTPPRLVMRQVMREIGGLQHQRSRPGKRRERRDERLQSARVEVLAMATGRTGVPGKSRARKGRMARMPWSAANRQEVSTGAAEASTRAAPAGSPGTGPNRVSNPLPVVAKARPARSK